ncbi:hypothetical protein H4219_002017 [Mycoemilia scoparia]|uniref:Uncharacterized protein n=1 Tax=Mycoemilia scoparia TaxID=417184 RepID=A0A9W7ZYT1_9FUNG|nr:hypothetical protein H4219_002017 [Mycoemilia scoparia]
MGKKSKKESKAQATNVADKNKSSAKGDVSPKADAKKVDEIDDIFSGKSKAKSQAKDDAEKNEKAKKVGENKESKSQKSDKSDKKKASISSKPKKEVKVVDASGKGDNPLKKDEANLSQLKKRNRSQTGQTESNDIDDLFADSRGKKSSKYIFILNRVHVQGKGLGRS